MVFLPYVVAYIGMAVFLVAVVARFFMWSRMPLHLRWELYPVAHEAKRAVYGGSYLEESEWWKKPREVSLWGELKVMIPEILFLVALKEHNPRLWVRSFPFHLGLYLVAACTIMMMGTGLLTALLPAVMSGVLGSLFDAGILVCGAVGLILGLLGAVGLIERRLGIRELREYAAPADIFNLLFFIVAFGFAFASFILVDRKFEAAKAFVANLVTFHPAALPGEGLGMILPLISVLLLSLLVSYIPLTHMSHFVGKYFAYHSIRWNDAPNLRGGDEEATIQRLLAQKISWAAPHIEGKGEKSWADAATEEQKK